MASQSIGKRKLCCSSLKNASIKQLYGVEIVKIRSVTAQARFFRGPGQLYGIFRPYDTGRGFITLWICSSNGSMILSVPKYISDFYDELIYTVQNYRFMWSPVAPEPLQHAAYHITSSFLYVILFPLVIVPEATHTVFTHTTAFFLFCRRYKWHNWVYLAQNMRCRMLSKVEQQCTLSSVV